MKKVNRTERGRACGGPEAAGFVGDSGDRMHGTRCYEREPEILLVDYGSLVARLRIVNDEVRSAR